MGWTVVGGGGGGKYLHTLWGEDRGRGGDDTKLVSGGGKLEGRGGEDGDSTKVLEMLPKSGAFESPRG